MENLKDNKQIKENEKFRLIAYTRWGSQCANYLYPNKTQAIKEGRFLKRNHYAFSYHVYERYIAENKIIKMREIAKG